MKPCDMVLLGQLKSTSNRAFLRSTATNQLKLKAPDGKMRLTDVVDDREVFMKGIGYSYYYEES